MNIINAPKFSRTLCTHCTPLFLFSSEISGVVAGVLCGFGTDGSGQVISLNLSSQKGLIFSKRYHSLSEDSPGGSIMGGRLAEEGAQACLCKGMVHLSLS